MPTAEDTYPESDEYGLRRLMTQVGTKRRYSYDYGRTWGATPAKARDAAGLVGRYEIGGVCVWMTCAQAKRWNCGGATDRDLDTAAVYVADKRDGGGLLERRMTLRRALNVRLEPETARAMEGRPATLTGY